MRGFWLIFLTLFLTFLPLEGQELRVYLFPGQGADHRQFRDIRFPVDVDTVHISYPVPDKRESMESFALSFIPLIDQEHPFVLMGVSLGGMLCTELADTLNPLGVIVVSSAKSYMELPGRYTFMRKFHLNRIIPKRLVKGGSRMLQGIVEPDRRYDPKTFKSMIRAKDPLYLKRTVDMIVNWNRIHHDPDIVHIHGNSDNTIPVRNVNCDYLIPEGSHMMILSRAEEINLLLEKIFPIFAATSTGQ